MTYSQYRYSLNEDMQEMNLDDKSRQVFLDTIDDISKRQQYLDFANTNIRFLNETDTYLVQVMNSTGVTNLDEFLKYKLLRIYVSYNLPFLLHGIKE
jgi:hypothetical protein